jgi:AcrR family transcriptional regulator
MRRPGSKAAGIISSAADVMASEGMQAASMKEISRRSGVSKSLLHYYFNGKEDLLAEVVTALEDEVDAFWKRAVAAHDDPWERFAADIQALSDLYSQRPKFWELLLELFVASRRNPKLKQPAQRLVNRLVQNLRLEVEATTSKMPIPTPVPNEDAATMIAGLMYGLSLIHLVDGRDVVPALRAFSVTALMAGALTYVMAGEQPPLDRLLELALSHPRPTSGPDTAA